MRAHSPATSFDLFGTLVAVEEPADPGAAIATALDRRDVPVPDDWATAYREPHLDLAPGREVPLPAHVRAALASRGVSAHPETITTAVQAAFDREVQARPGATRAILAAADRGRVGVLSNCSVPGLVEDVLGRADLPADQLDAIVTSVGCGWRKPAPQCFRAMATSLDVSIAQLTHVGDDPETDVGITDCGGDLILLDTVSLEDVPQRLEAGTCHH